MYVIEGLSDRTNNMMFRVVIEGAEYTFRLHSFRGVLYCSIYVNGAILHGGAKCINNKWLLPYKYMSSGGNFRFESSFDEYIDMKNIDKIMKLYYYSPEEYSAMTKE